MHSLFFFFFFFNDTATTEIYTLSLHDALPCSQPNAPRCRTSTCRTSEVAVRRAPEYESAAISVTKVRALPCPDRADPRYRHARRSSFPASGFEQVGRDRGD